MEKALMEYSVWQGMFGNGQPIGMIFLVTGVTSNVV